MYDIQYAFMFNHHSIASTTFNSLCSIHNERSKLQVGGLRARFYKSGWKRTGRHFWCFDEKFSVALNPFLRLAVCTFFLYMFYSFFFFRSTKARKFHIHNSFTRFFNSSFFVTNVISISIFSRAFFNFHLNHDVFFCI